MLEHGREPALEDVATVGHPRWFQLYWYTDRELTRSLIERAQAAGYGAIVLTVDAAIFGWREGEQRVTLVKPDGAWAVNLPEDVSTIVQEQTITWSDLEWLRAVSPLPIVLKGIVRGGDARLAVEHGVDGIMVSNHGGRQVDGGDRDDRCAAGGGRGGPAAARRAGGRGRPEVYVDGGDPARHRRAEGAGPGRPRRADRAAGPVGPRGRRRGRDRPDDGTDDGRVPLGAGPGAAAGRWPR